MKFFKGFLIGAILLFIVNFFMGFMDKCTLTSVKGMFTDKDTADIKVDSISEDVINLNIAKYLQSKYGADSLMIETISVPSTIYEYYVSGIKGTRKFDNPNERVKKVTFKKGSDEYRILVIYTCNDGVVKVVENDTSPINTINPIENDPHPIQPSQIPNAERNDSIKNNPNNRDIGTPTNGNGDFNNESDV